MYRLYNIGAKTEPWGISAAIFLGVENSPSTKTLNFLSVRKETICLMTLVENSNSDSSFSRPECHVVSEAFLIFRNTAGVDRLLLKLEWRDPPASHTEVSYSDLLESQTDLHLVSSFLSVVWIVLKISFTNSSPVVDKKLIERKFWVCRVSA
jgi:hypothetical protein